MITISDREFKEFAAFVKAHYGIHFKEEKKTLIEGRLGFLLASLNMNSFTDYMDYVKADTSGQAASTMLDKITTNYTFFMREPEHFRYFQETVLPYLAATVHDRDLRIWSAACSSGEEPYTLAMLIDQYFGSGKKDWDTSLLATDISQKVLSTALEGVYDEEKIQDLPKIWQSRYFNRLGNGRHQVKESIRREVLFRNMNLMSERFPFRRKMHVIFCRNVMIYFDNQVKSRLIQKLYDITEPGGFLFIGHSEALNRSETRYKYVAPAIYRKE